ncbi:MAG TPA: excinuclease ABC subunit A, partial [Luteolibacter sp.]|nr:excinuclease ABC subunit A [Luteolibacter sp.]
EELKPDSPESAQQWTLAHLDGHAVVVGFPVAVPPNSKADEIFSLLNQQGYLRVWHQGRLWRTDETVDKALLKSCSEVQVVQDRIEVGRRQASRLLEALEAALRLGKGRAAVWEVQGKGGREFTTTWSNPATGFTLRAPSPALFSFNSPIGACPVCRGFGRVIGIDPAKAIPDPSLSIAQGAIKPFQGERGAECQRDLLRCCRERKIDVRTPWEDLSNEEREWIYDGDRGKTPQTLEQLDELWRDGGWYGVRGFFAWLESKAYKMHVRVFLSRFRAYTTCATCRGSRLQPEALCFRVAGRTLAEFWRMPVSDLLPLFDELAAKHERTARQSDPTLPLVLGEVRSRLACLDQVGLGYLTLDRATRTLSGGELERVNLTACLGAALTGTLFVLDEPTVGLHARDIQRLIGVMQRLRDAGNTLVVVEHERAVIEAADHLIDLGPGAGQHGGRLLHAGPLAGAKSSGGEGTLAWLEGRRSIPRPARRRQPDGRRLSIRGASRHNLSKFDVDIPLGLFVCVTGVSGSGKSTFAHDVIYQNLARKLGVQLEGEDEAATLRSLAIQGRLDGVELVDQSPVARTPRSAPALLLGAFDPIRQLFCETPEALANGLKPGFFSFNAGEGRCDRCAGNGYEKVEMQFLSDLYVTCPDCNGTRYKASTLEYHLDGMSIAHALN